MMKNDKMRIYGTLEALVEQLQDFEDLNEITKFEVVEKFGDKPVRKFEFLNLKAEIFEVEGERGILFVDAEGKIYDTYSVLLGFLERSIQTAYFSIPKHGICEIRLILSDGYVDITAHVNYEISDWEDDFDSPEMDEVYREYYSEEHDYSY